MASDNPNPIFSFIFFTILTICYFIVKYIFLKDNNYTYLLVALYCYLGINIISQLIINISLTNQICGQSQWYNAFFITIIPWIAIFGSLSVLLKIFPGWLIPFSNTFGYGVARLGGINKLFEKILVSDTKTKSKELNKALQNIYSDQSLLINQVGIDNFDTFWDSLKNANMLNADVTSEDKKQFRSFVNLKTLISEFIWFLLVGLLTISASYNYIINIACEKSLASMKARHEKYNEDLELEKQAEEAAPEARTFTTYQ